MGLTFSLSSSDEAEELLPAAPGERFGAPFREPPLLGLARFVLNGGEDGGIERLLQVLLRERRALHVVGRPDLLRHAAGPRAQHGLDVGAVQVDEDVHVQEEVRLGAHEDDGRGRVVRPDLRDPLLGDVVEGGGVDHAEAQEEDVRVGVGQRPEFVELLLNGTKRAKKHKLTSVCADMTGVKKADSLWPGENITH